MPITTLPLGTEVEYRAMKGTEEDILSNPKKGGTGEGMEEVLANCTLRLGENTKVKVSDIQRLKNPDRASLVMAIRQATFGNDLNAETRCTSCGVEFGFKVDLSQLPYTPPLEDGPPYEVTLEVDGKPVRITVDHIDGKGEAMLLKAKDSMATTALLLSVKDIEGVEPNDKKRWLADLSIPARKRLRELLEEKLRCGIDPVVNADCTECGAENAVNVMAQADFFYH